MPKSPGSYTNKGKNLQKTSIQKHLRFSWHGKRPKKNYEREINLNGWSNSKLNWIKKEFLIERSAQLHYKCQVMIRPWSLKYMKNLRRQTWLIIVSVKECQEMSKMLDILRCHHREKVQLRSCYKVRKMVVILRCLLLEEVLQRNYC